MSLTAGTRLGPYEILGPIGAGGMGEVYKARDTRLDRVVAIKVSKDQFSERFEREARAVAALDTVAGQLENEYGSLHVRWGDVLRFRRGSIDLPGNGAPSMMGAIRTVNPGPFANGKAQGIGGDTYFAVIEFSNPVRAEALLSYGNWSKPGSPHVEDQMRLLSRKEMRPVWRTRKEIEANLESRKVF